MTGCHFLGYDQTNESPSKAQNKLLFRETGLDSVDVQNHSFSKSFVGFAFVTESFVVFVFLVC